ncbi:MAG: aminotransferase class III-fold pyridoxal phosphate-dependent enzyme [Planctomycetota bacterium]
MSATRASYDLAAEPERYAFADVTVGGLSLNRGTARVQVAAADAERSEHTRAAHRAALLTTTLAADSPVLELGYPVAGMYVMSSAGVYLDLYLGVAQKLFDENHPRLRRMLASLQQWGLTLRREINTDDYLGLRAGVADIVTPQQLARLFAETARRSLGAEQDFQVFFSNSGTEAIECALKLAQVCAYKRLLRNHGMPSIERLMRDLQIEREPFFDHDPNGPVYRDYPFFLIGCDGAFHGRTMGALHLTRSKAAHQLGYSKFPWTRHLRFNGDASELEGMIDPRPLRQLLDAPGGVRACLAQGKLPAELIAGFVVEGFQGEGGYRMADRNWLRDIRRLCERHGILFIADEVQSFCRTGTVFFIEQFGVVPDLIATAKAAVVGVTLARADLGTDLHPGWHSNTWGGGKILDVQWSHATLDTMLHHQDPVFRGLTYLENLAVKGAYIQDKLEDLRRKHPRTLLDFSGVGGMWGVSVRWRERIIQVGWNRGIKLLGCGVAGEISRLRLIFLADVLAKEIDEFAAVFDRVLAEVESEAA